MIFGFNTDVKLADVTYHVQSEARKNDHLLQTQVFVKGRCVGKRAVSYAEEMTKPDFTEDRMQEILRGQHKQVVEAIRAGKLDGIDMPGQGATQGS